MPMVDLCNGQMLGANVEGWIAGWNAKAELQRLKEVQWLVE